MRTIKRPSNEELIAEMKRGLRNRTHPGSTLQLAMPARLSELIELVGPPPVVVVSDVAPVKPWVASLAESGLLLWLSPDSACVLAEDSVPALPLVLPAEPATTGGSSEEQATATPQSMNNPSDRCMSGWLPPRGHRSLWMFTSSRDVAQMRPSGRGCRTSHDVSRDRAH